MDQYNTYPPRVSCRGTTALWPARRQALDLSDDELALSEALGCRRHCGAGGREVTRDCPRIDRGHAEYVTVDSALPENVRASLRWLVKRVLREHGSPPDDEQVTHTVLGVAELPAAGWSA